jgi:hypothetical protein
MEATFKPLDALIMAMVLPDAYSSPTKCSPSELVAVLLPVAGAALASR